MLKTKLLTTASDPNHPGWLQFKSSLDHFGWDYHLIVHEYTGYNSKIVAFYNYLKEHPEITHFIYADSYDSFALSTQKEVEDKFTNWHGLMYGVEKACWPYENWASEYPESPYPHKYLNGGGFMGSSAAFIAMYEANAIGESGWDNDQIWAQNEYLRRNDGTIKLDRGCNIFQPTAHRGIEDFAILNLQGSKRVLNLHTMSAPILLHQNGKSDGQWIWDLLPEKVKLSNNMNLTDLKNSWVDEPDYHKEIHETFIDNVNNDIELKAHRDWVEQNIFGFGERSFHYLWKLLLSELPEASNLLEIGIFRGQTISLWKMLRPNSKVFGVSPLDSTGGHWESDYEADVRRIHDHFGLEQPIIFKGLSGDKEIVWAAQERMYDLVYLDGGHTYEVVANDFLNYAPLVKVGGYLVIDDCNCEMHMPFGFFQGIEDVTKAKIKYMETTDEGWEFVCSVVHISVFKRI